MLEIGNIAFCSTCIEEKEMKKLLFALVCICSLVFITGCTEQERAKDFGGATTVTLPKGQKLVNVTWKQEGNLWYLVRPMRAGEVAETYQFKESSSFGVMEGQVTLTETR